MKKYKVYHSHRFDRELSKFNQEFLKRVDRIEDQLTENPYAGKPLGVKWLREKKIEKYRIYYLVYEKSKIIFMVAVSGKKDQQKIINSIRLTLSFLKKEIDEIIDGEDST